MNEMIKHLIEDLNHSSNAGELRLVYYDDIIEEGIEFAHVMADIGQLHRQIENDSDLADFITTVMENEVSRPFNRDILETIVCTHFPTEHEAINARMRC